MTGKSVIPLGKPETDRQVFLGRSSLDDARSLARAVAALLNARGGSVWIGLTEREGVAATVESVAPLQRRATRLRERLIDLVEPRPIPGEEIAIVPVSVPESSDQGLVKVEVKPGRRGPYAFLDGALRGYVVRAGVQTRLMTSDELRARFSRKHPGDVREAVSAALLQALSESATRGFRGLELLIQPAVAAGLELPLARSTLERALQDPVVTGNRPLGWVFADARGELRATRGRFAFGNRANRERVIVQRNGLIRYRESLERLVWNGPPGEIWPYALAEFPTSVLRLARHLYAAVEERVDPETPVVAALALFGIKGWLLRPHSPRAVAHLTVRASRSEEEAIIPVPLVFTWKELQSSPDRCAFRLMVQVYGAFGYPEDAVPEEFSRETGALTFAS